MVMIFLAVQIRSRSNARDSAYIDNADDLTYSLPNCNADDSAYMCNADDSIDMK